MGVSKYLDLDDTEHRLLATHVELGLWLRPEASSLMEFSLEEADQGQRMPENQHEPESAASTSEGSSGVSQRGVIVQFRNHRVKGVVHMGEDGWQPAKLTVQVHGKDEISYYHCWRKHESCHWFPRTIHQLTEGDSRNEVEILGSSSLTCWENSLFSLPPTQLRPPDTTFDPPEGGSIPAWWTASGHLLVHPRIDGKELGYMILDTGASGFCIDKKVADTLDMLTFGEYQLSGMMDQFKSCMRRSRDIQLGPLTIQRPMYMEMEVHGLVKDPPGRVIGIVGYDVFRRCVMRIPRSETMKGIIQVQLEDPSLPEESGFHEAEEDPRWQSLDFVSSLPIVKAKIGTDASEHEVRFMIDSGAGGVDLMFNGRATERLKLLEAIITSTRLLRGVGGNNRHTVKSGVLPWISISELRHEKLDCLFLGSNGLDLSVYVDGIICSHILARCSTVLDFARNRIMFVQENPVTGRDN